MAQQIRSSNIATIILSWVAGFADTAGFLRLNGLFTAHVTGNLIVAGAQLAGTGDQGVWVRLAVVFVFIAAVVLTTIITRTQNPRLSSLLWFEVVTLVIFTTVGVALVPTTKSNVDSLTMFVVGSTGVFAMGVQNALMRETFGTLAQTTVMTGNLTQFAIDVTRKLLIRNSYKAESKASEQELHQRMSKFGGALVGFVLGAACGAFLMRSVGFWCILLPTGAIALLAVDTQRQG